MIYDIVADLGVQRYQALLDELGRRPLLKFGLVVRSSDRLSRRAAEVLTRLDPWKLSDNKSMEWPGTRMLTGDGARVRLYRLNAESSLVLKQASAGLFDWQEPDLPSDLFFLAEDDRPLLVNVAHHGEAMLVDPDQGLLQLLGDLVKRR